MILPLEEELEILPLDLDIGGLGRESEVDVAHLLFTLNKVTAQVIYHPSSSTSPSIPNPSNTFTQVLWR